MFTLRLMTMAILMAVVSSNVIEDLNCKAQTVAAEAQLQNTVFVEGLIKCLKRFSLKMQCTTCFHGHMTQTVNGPHFEF